MIYYFVQLNTICNSKSNASLSADRYPESQPVKFATPAKFPGGINAWKKYLSVNTNYPLQAQKNKMEGVVKVEYIIDINGVVTSVQAINLLGYGLSEEAQRVIKASPKWTPAKLKGKTIEYRFIQDIVFKLK